MIRSVNDPHAQEDAGIVMREITDPAELAKLREHQEWADRNWAWFQAHAAEIYKAHRGKCICIAGEELFVADAPEEVLAKAKAAHPEDKGHITHYIYKEKKDRVYGHRGGMGVG